jgi:hypothetical protein
MSATAGLVADEICVMTRGNPYDAGQRALWHIDSVGRMIDCTSRHVSEDLELLYAIPQPQKSFSSSSAFPHSASSEEFGLHVFPPSPRSQGGSPPLAGNNSSNESQCRFLRISEKTRVKFFSPIALTVFSLDLSPSMNVVDTSFKSLTTGCHLVDTLVRGLEISLKALLTGGSALVDPAPAIIVTVVAHGVPSLGQYPLVVGRLLDSESSVSAIIETVIGALRPIIQTLSKWLQGNHVSEQLAGPASCSRTRNACTSLVCQANDVSTIVRDCLTAISLTCAQMGLSKASVCKSILIVTDGVMSHPRKLPYDNALMHLNFVDVALHIIQVGGGFAPWSALGYASDPDLLRLLAASTPTGLFLQDHHVKVGTGALWLGCVCKLSNKRVHTPYKSASYQSSSVLGGFFPTYLNQLGLVRKEFSLEGIASGEEVEASSSLGSWSPIAAAKSFSDSDLEEDDETDEPIDDVSANRPMSLRAYLKPEKGRARPYLYKQYKLPHVSVAQLVQLRTKEGFVLSGSQKKSAASNSRLGRTASLNSVDSLVGSPSSPSPTSAVVSMKAHWGPVVDVLYEISKAGDDHSVLVKIYLRMPSGDFFLRFKQTATSSLGGDNSSSNFWQMCKQLEAFTDTILAVDDSLAKVTNIVPDIEFPLLHRWFTVRSLFVLLEVSPPARLRHGTIDSLLKNARERVLKDLASLPGLTEQSGSHRFLYKRSELFGENLLDNHAVNALGKSNENIFATLNDSLVSGPSPFVVIEIANVLPDAAQTHAIGIAKINMAFSATSPCMERAFIESLSRHISKSGTGCHPLEAPSPIIRAIQAGLLITSAKPHKKQVPAVPRSPSTAPDMEAVGRFMRFHEWQATCPPAALASDVITTIHERRLKEGWRCVYESTSAAIYITFTPFEMTFCQPHRSTSREVPGRVVWIPDFTTEDGGTQDADFTEAHQVNVDWERLLNSRSASSRCHDAMKAIHGACTCLCIHHSQARGEKPVLKCRVWADRGHPTWSSPNKQIEFETYCEQLCVLVEKPDSD